MNIQNRNTKLIAITISSIRIITKMVQVIENSVLLQNAACMTISLASVYSKWLYSIYINYLTNPPAQLLPQKQNNTHEDQQVTKVKQKLKYKIHKIMLLTF